MIDVGFVFVKLGYEIGVVVYGSYCEWSYFEFGV